MQLQAGTRYVSLTSHCDVAHAKNQILLLPPYLWPRCRPASIKTSMYQSSRYQGTLDKMRRHTLGKEIEVDSEKSGWSAPLPQTVDRATVLGAAALA